LKRAVAGEPRPTDGGRGQTPAARAFAALRRGDLPSAQSIAAAAPGWAAARAALAAGAVRVDPHAAVGYAALRGLTRDLDGSAGTVERDATLWRIAALALREEAYFPTDAPPPLGRRLEPEDLERQLAERMEDEEPTILRETPSAPAARGSAST